MTPILSREGFTSDNVEVVVERRELRTRESKRRSIKNTLSVLHSFLSHLPGPYKKIILVTLYFPDTQHHKFALRYISKALPITDVIVA